MTTLRSFIAANPSAAWLLLLISILTWSSCSLASPFSSQPDDATTTTTAATELIQPELMVAAAEEKGTSSDGVGTRAAAVTTTGTCKAILPDGRLQTVVYTCAPTGYSAVVQFHKAENQSAATAATAATHQQHERNQMKTNAPAATLMQQPLQPITEILFLRPTTTDSSARVTTTTTEKSPSIATTKKVAESMVAIVPPHRFHIESDQFRTVPLVQLPSLPLSTTTAATTTPAATKRHRSTTTTASAAAAVGDAATTPAPINRKRIRTRWNIGAGSNSSSEQPPL